MRLDNCLIQDDQANNLGRLYLVDWELAGWGDARYDIGAVIADYLALWVRSMPTANSLSVGDSVASAARPLADIRPNLQAFWAEYRTGSAATTGEPAFLIECFKWAGARLVQSAIESAQEAATLSGAVVLLLQMAENVLDNPGRAARLVGIE
jgi:thiamine kinase-like enzyme